MMANEVGGVAPQEFESDYLLKVEMRMSFPAWEKALHKAREPVAAWRMTVASWLDTADDAFRATDAEAEEVGEKADDGDAELPAPSSKPPSAAPEVTGPVTVGSKPTSLPSSPSRTDGLLDDISEEKESAALPH